MQQTYEGLQSEQPTAQRETIVEQSSRAGSEEENRMIFAVDVSWKREGGDQ
jgi:hypothetical protein